MKVKDTNALAMLVARLFAANGVDMGQAMETAEILVRTNMLGFSSHGVYRTKQYINEIKNNGIVANAPIETAFENGAAAVVDGHWNFGQLTAKAAAAKAIGLAKEYGVSFVGARRANHIGSLGIYTRMIAGAGCVALGYCGNNGGGHWVAPFGGRQGRLSTNPISFASPADGGPIAMDFSTSMIPEGRIRQMRDAGEKIAPDLAVNNKGEAITDPGDFYNTSPKGAILPFGGAQGYKGFGLSVMSQVMSGLLCGANWRPDGNDDNIRGNAASFIAIDIAHITGLDDYRHEVAAFAGFVKSSDLLPGHAEIVLPGELENRKLTAAEAEGLELDSVTADMLEELCAAHNIPFEVR